MRENVEGMSGKARARDRVAVWYFNEAVEAGYLRGSEGTNHEVDN